MIFASDWRVDPDGRDTEDRKNGPVTEYKLTPEEIEKLLKGAKKMTETVTNYEVKGTEKKRMTKKVVREMAANGMTEDQIVEYFNDGSTRQSMTKAKVILYLKPDEPKEEKPVEVTPAEEPIEVHGTEEQAYDFWDGVKHELWGMKESEIDKINEDFEKVLARWVGGDHSEETTAALMFYGEKVLNV